METDVETEIEESDDDDLGDEIHKSDDEMTMLDSNDEVRENENRKNHGNKDENNKHRPKIYAKIEFKKKNDEKVYEGFVKHVRKRYTKKRNVCWINIKGNVEELDFLKDIDSWKYWKKV